MNPITSRVELDVPTLQNSDSRFLTTNSQEIVFISFVCY